MLTPRRAEGCEFDPRPGQYSRMSFSSDQVTGTVFPHLNRVGGGGGHSAQVRAYVLVGWLF